MCSFAPPPLPPPPILYALPPTAPPSTPPQLIVVLLVDNSLVSIALSVTAAVARPGFDRVLLLSSVARHDQVLGAEAFLKAQAAALRSRASGLEVDWAVQVGLLRRGGLARRLGRLGRLGQLELARALRGGLAAVAV